MNNIDYLSDDQVHDQIVFKYGYKAPDWKNAMKQYGVPLHYCKNCTLKDGTNYCKGHYDMPHMRKLLKKIVKNRLHLQRNVL